MVQNGNFTLLLTSSGQEWQLADLPADLPPTLTSSGARLALSHLLLTPSGQEWQFHMATDI